VSRATGESGALVGRAEILYRRCYQHMSARGWLKGERREPEFVGPEWLPSAFRVARDSFGVGPAELSERLHLTPQTFTAVTGEPVEPAKALDFKVMSRGRTR